MNFLLDTLSQQWAIRALIASCVVGVTCGVLGTFMVLRNMALIGDAISHAILPGIFVAFVLVGNYSIAFLGGSLAAALLATVMMTWIQDNVKTKNDAAIGIIFTVMFSLGVIGISYLNNKQGVHLDLKDFLFGTILGVSDEDIVISITIMTYTLASIAIFYRYLFITTFQATIASTMGISVKMVHYFLMTLLSLAVVSALRTVGIILVVAMLITPASTALLLTDKLKNVLIVSGVIGLISAALGLILAILWNTTPGPLMCVVATLLYGLAIFFSPSKGLLFKYLRRNRQRVQIQKEDIIKYLSKAASPNASFNHIGQALNLSPRTVKSLISALSKDGFVATDPTLALTAKGRNTASDLVRAHRLWETFLVESVGLGDQDIHDDAEKHEHLLNDKMMDHLDARLGYPTLDPHGSPIPSKLLRAKKPLMKLRPNDRARISTEQISDFVESQLWELGLSANSQIQVISIDSSSVIIKCQENTISVDAELAEQINLN